MKIDKKLEFTRDIILSRNYLLDVEELKHSMLKKRRYDLDDKLRIIKEYNLSLSKLWDKVSEVYPETKNKECYISGKGIFIKSN